MFSELVFDPNNPTEQEAIVTTAASTTWGGLAERASRFLRQLGPLENRRVGFCFRRVAESFAALAALDRLCADVFLLDGDLTPAATRELAQRFHLAALVVPADGRELVVEQLDGEEPGNGGGSVAILTSGTTGTPKAARHTWASLSRPARVAPDQRGARWMLTYRPNLYAGVQVILQCLVNRGTLLIPDPAAAADAIAEFMRSARAQYSSGTPSYWRRLLLFANAETLRQVGLRQITLGGELVDQQILDGLRNHFPQARIVHIYATTELGRCFSVTDGRAGFPASFLTHPSPDGVQLRDRDGELMVRSANAMQDYDGRSESSWTEDGWFATGDLIQVDGERVYFVGRRSELINVGGNKVHPTEVEHVIRKLSGVADVVVYKKPSTLAGELVVCDVVPEPDQDRQALRRALGAHCAQHLAAHQRPRLVRIVEEIRLSSSGKKIRKS